MVGRVHPTWLVVSLALVGLLLTACETTDSNPTPTADEESVSMPVPEPINYDRPDFDALWDYNDPAGTEDKFREILAEAEAAKDWAFIAELLTQIARTQGLQHEFDNAHVTLNAAKELIKEPKSIAYVRYLLERGRVYNSSNQPAKARPLFREAFDLTQVIADQVPDADYYALDAAHMLGIVEKGRQALAWNEHAIAMAEASSDPRLRKWLGPLYNNTAWTYHDLGEYDRALELFQAALEFRQSQGEQRTIQIARWSVARCLRSLGRVEEALQMQQELLAELTAGGATDGFVNEEIGECLLLLDRPDEARPQFAQAYALLSRDLWLVNNESQRLQRLQELATGEQSQTQ